MEEQKITIKEEEGNETKEEVSKVETDFFSKFGVDCRDEENVVGVICKEEGYKLLVEKVGYEGFCKCFLGERFTDVEILRIWANNKLVNP